MPRQPLRGRVRAARHARKQLRESVEIPRRQQSAQQHVAAFAIVGPRMKQTRHVGQQRPRVARACQHGIVGDRNGLGHYTRQIARAAAHPTAVTRRVHQDTHIFLGKLRIPLPQAGVGYAPQRAERASEGRETVELERLVYRLVVQTERLREQSVEIASDNIDTAREKHIVGGCYPVTERLLGQSARLGQRQQRITPQHGIGRRHLGRHSGQDIAPPPLLGHALHAVNALTDAKLPAS